MAIDIDSTEFRTRFWSRVQPAGDEECWPWMRSCQTAGYGQIYVGDTAHRAHRLAFYFANGRWPNVVCHECHNPICCNPAHLTDGTFKLNTHQAQVRGTKPRGERCSWSRLKEQDVHCVRQRYANGESPTQIGRDFEITATAVIRIAQRKMWKHV